MRRQIRSQPRSSSDNETADVLPWIFLSWPDEVIGMKTSEEIVKMAEGMREEIISLRRHFHTHPETSWNEYETQKAIISYLEGLGLSCVKAAETGVIATLAGPRSDGRILGIRADIDALPIKEETGLPFASANEGVSHACGHDNHIAMGLAAAKLLTEMKDELPVTVRFVFQPAEEAIHHCGAKVMREHPLVTECSRMIAMHIWSRIPAGYAGISEGPVMASADTFDITVTGRGGHGAQPQETVDPVPAAAELVTSLQRIVSRETDPLDTAVLSVTSFHAGTTYNVIPDTAKLSGTVRTYSEKVSEEMPVRMERVCRGIGEASATKIELDYHRGNPPLTNDAAAASSAKKAAAPVFGADKIIDIRFMVSEDFADYTQPKCMLFLGGGLADEEKRFPQHSPYYVIDENVLPLGVAYFANYVFTYGAE